MLLRNFPLSNARPKGREQTNNYVKALDLKQEADQLAQAMVGQNENGNDLDPSPNGVALNYKEIYMGNNLRRGDVTGVASFEGSQEAPESLLLQADIVPDRGADRTLTRREDGDVVRYTRQFKNNEAVEHMVYDSGTDRFSFFLRDEQGHFLPKS